MINSIPLNSNSQLKTQLGGLLDLDILNRINLLKGNMSIYRLSREVDIEHTTIRTWNSKIPRADAVVKVAKYFNVSADYLLGLEERDVNIPPPIIPEEIERTWLVMTPQQRMATHQFMKGMLSMDTRKEAVAFCEEEGIERPVFGDELNKKKA